ncbi:MAG: hypothetical protein M1814_000655 [Vezdaea aestivalis]|nr:MAG: hypothetical protein M1814_000655 [Vezdaea aestivalis]
MAAPVDLWTRLKLLVLPADAQSPAIAVTSAAALSILYTLFYILPFYLFRTTRPSPTLSRDSPSVIRARIRIVSLAAPAFQACTAYVILSNTNSSLPQALHLLGIWPIAPLPILSSLSLTVILFAAPLFESAFAYGEWRAWLRGHGVVETLRSWIGYRNLVAGPVTEELVFRSAIIPLHLVALVQPSKIVFLAPLYFGIAHIHHCYEYTLTHPDTPLGPAIFRSVFQFAYTTVFGWFATFVFLRTGSLPAVVLVHSLCNWYGLPRLWGRLEADLPEEEDDRGRRLKKDSAKPEEKKPGLKWTVSYYTLLALGSVAFWKCLWVLTECDGALVQFQR